MSRIVHFTGELALNRTLQAEHFSYLMRFSEIRHELLRVEGLERYPDPLRAQVGLPPGPYGIYFAGYVDPFFVGDDFLRFEFADDGFHKQERLAACYQMIAPEQNLFGYLRNTIFEEDDTLNDEEKEQKFLSLWQEKKWITTLLPNIWCLWLPMQDRKFITVEPADKFPSYVEWLHFLLDHFLGPWGYELSGRVDYHYQDGQRGFLIVERSSIQEVVTHPRSE